jgi:hypothetical protein
MPTEQIINSLRYSIYNAEQIVKFSEYDFYSSEGLYKTKNGRFFEYEIIDSNTLEGKIKPLTEDEAYNWLIKNGFNEILNDHFNIEEA